MHRFLASVLVLTGLAAAPAFADEPAAGASVATTVPNLSLTSALRSAQGGDRHNLIQGSGFSIGMLSASPSAFGNPFEPSRIGSGVTGFLDWGMGGYHLDALVRPSLDGGMTADVGAYTSVVPGLPSLSDTTYGVHLGTATGAQHFTINPTSRFGMTEVPNTPTDLNLSFTVNHALASGVSVIGTAEARRGISGIQPDLQQASSKELLLGAGLGIKF